MHILGKKLIISMLLLCASIRDAPRTLDLETEFTERAEFRLAPEQAEMAESPFVKILLRSLSTYSSGYDSAQPTRGCGLVSGSNL